MQSAIVKPTQMSVHIYTHRHTCISHYSRRYIRVHVFTYVYKYTSMHIFVLVSLRPPLENNSTPPQMVGHSHLLASTPTHTLFLVLNVLPSPPCDGWLSNQVSRYEVKGKLLKSKGNYWQRNSFFFSFWRGEDSTFNHWVVSTQLTTEDLIYIYIYVYIYIICVLPPHSSRAHYIRNGHRWCGVQ